MRRMSGLLALALALLLALPVAAVRAEPEPMRIDVTVGAGTAYMLKDNALWRLNGVYAPEEQRCAYAVDVRSIFAREEALYVAYRDGGAIHFARQDETGALDELFAVEGEADVVDFAVAGSALAVLWHPTEQETALDGVYRFSAFSLAGERRNWGLNYVAALAPCGEDRLLLAHGDVDFWQVSEIDPMTGGRKTASVEESGSILAVAGTLEECYLLDETGINRLNGDGTLNIVQMLDGQASPGMIRTDDALICFSMNAAGEEPALQVRRLRDESAKLRTLTVDLRGNIGLQDDRMRRAIQKLQAENPDAQVEFDSLSDEQLNTILMAGGDGADVVLVTAGYDRYSIDSGAFQDLNGVPELCEALEPLEYLLPHVTNDRGALYGVPVSAFLNKLYEFQQLKYLEPADLDVGDCTWLELLEAAMSFGRFSRAAFLMDVDTEFPTWLRQYIAAEGDDVSFDTPLFRELAEAYRAALNAGKLRSSFGPDKGNCLYMLDSRDSETLYGDALLPPPKLEADCPARLVTVKSFAVNARCNNRELALQFLLDYIDPEVVYAEGGYDHMRLDEPQFVDMEQFSKRERALISENQAACAQAIPGRETYSFLVACEQWMPQYYDGRITLDELIAGLQREWDMRRMG